MSDVVLSLRNVSKRFGSFQALHPVNLEIGAGEFMTLLGPSGCGKTTLLRIIAGFEQPSTGELLLDDREITGLPPERRPFNMVFQSYALFPHLNVFDNIAYGLRIGGGSETEVRRKVMAALDIVGLGGHAAMTVDQLSGGMSQRVALVRAIINEPRILLLDEPLSALDLQLRKRMQIELRSIQERIRTTFIHVTHDQEEALMMSHRIVLMNHGVVEQKGSPQELYNRPGSRFAAEFIGETNLIPCRVLGKTVTAWMVEVAGGATAEFPSYGRMESTDSAHLSIRPQELTLRPAGQGLMDGILADRLFNGYTDAVVRVGAELIIRVRLDESDLPTIGTKVGLAPRPGKGAIVS
jgi:ABC-type Fe3+/spermidine/putrescine transport system ATPase subunit